MKKTESKILPKNDLVFQTIFGKTGNEKITERLLSLIMNRKIDGIDLDVNKRLLGNHMDEKIARLDVRAKLSSGEDFNIEIQVAQYGHMAQRILYYWSRMYGIKLPAGKIYTNLTPTVSILITDYEIKELKEIEEYHTQWNLREKIHQNKILTPNIEIHILEIPKILKQQKIKQDALAIWLKFLANPDDEEVVKMIEKDPILEQAMKELEHLRGDPDFEFLLERRVDAIRDELSIRAEAEEQAEEQGMKKGLKKGMNQGIQQGMQQGMQQGIQQGMQQGIKQGEKSQKMKMAKKMKEKNIPLEEILEITGLTKKEWEQL